MNLNPQVLAISAVLGVPVFPTWGEVPKNSAEYIVFVYEDDRPQVYADNGDYIDGATVAVHWFFRGGDAQTKKEALRNALRSQGLAIGATQELYENDTMLTHIVVSVSG